MAGRATIEPSVVVVRPKPPEKLSCDSIGGVFTSHPKKAFEKDDVAFRLLRQRKYSGGSNTVTLKRGRIFCHDCAVRVVGPNEVKEAERMDMVERTVRVKGLTPGSVALMAASDALATAILDAMTAQSPWAFQPRVRDALFDYAGAAAHEAI